MALWDAPTDAFWMVVTTTTGHRFVAQVIDGVSHTAWPLTWGTPDRVDLLNTDLNVVWTDDQ